MLTKCYFNQHQKKLTRIKYLVFTERYTIMMNEVKEATIEETVSENIQDQEYNGFETETKTIGNGNYTAEMLETWSGIEKRLLVRGHKQEEIDFIYVTAICPKGHEEHMNQSSAAHKIFPDISPITVKCRIQKVLSDFVQQLFSGKIVDECREEWNKKRNKNKTSGTRNRLSIEEQAKQMAEHDLKKAFRKAKGLGERGRLKQNVKEEMENHMKQYLPNAIEKITADLKEAEADLKEND